MVDRRPEQPGLKEVHTVQVGDVNTSGVGLGTFTSVLLDVHAKETDVDAVDLFKGEQGSGAVRELVGHLPVVAVSGINTRVFIRAKGNRYSLFSLRFPRKSEVVVSTYRAFIMGLTSTVLSPLNTTRM